LNRNETPLNNQQFTRFYRKLINEKARTSRAFQVLRLNVIGVRIGYLRFEQPL